MYHSKPYELNDAEKSCSICGTGLFAITALPVFGLFCVASNIHDSIKNKKVRARMKIILKDVEYQDLWFEKGMLAGWTYQGRTYMMFDETQRTHPVELSIAKMIEKYWTEENKDILVIVADPSKVQSKDIQNVYAYVGGEGIKVFSIFGKAPRIENLTVSLPDGFYGILGKRFRVQYYEYDSYNWIWTVP